MVKRLYLAIIMLGTMMNAQGSQGADTVTVLAPSPEVNRTCAAAVATLAPKLAQQVGAAQTPEQLKTIIATVSASDDVEEPMREALTAGIFAGAKDPSLFVLEDKPSLCRKIVDVLGTAARIVVSVSAMVADTVIKAPGAIGNVIATEAPIIKEHIMDSLKEAREALSLSKIIERAKAEGTILKDSVVSATGQAVDALSGRFSLDGIKTEASAAKDAVVGAAVQAVGTLSDALSPSTLKTEAGILKDKAVEGLTAAGAGIVWTADKIGQGYTYAKNGLQKASNYIGNKASDAWSWATQASTDATPVSSANQFENQAATAQEELQPTKSFVANVSDAASNFGSTVSDRIKSAAKPISQGARQVQLWIQEKLGLLTIEEKLELAASQAKTADDLLQVEDQIKAFREIIDPMNFQLNHKTALADETYTLDGKELRFSSADAHVVFRKLQALERKVVGRQATEFNDSAKMERANRTTPASTVPDQTEQQKRQEEKQASEGKSNSQNRTGLEAHEK